MPAKASPAPGGSPGIPPGGASAPGEGHRFPLRLLPPFGDFGDFFRGEGAAPLSWENLHFFPYLQVPFSWNSKQGLLLRPGDCEPLL